MSSRGLLLSLGPLLSIITAVEVGPALAKHPRDLRVPLPAAIEGVGIGAGDYIVSWKMHSHEAVVRLTGKNTMIVAKGRPVQHDGRFERDAIVYSRRSDGSLAVIEIRLAGLDQALRFCEPGVTANTPTRWNLAAEKAAVAAEKTPVTTAAEGCGIATRVQFVGKPHRPSVTPTARRDDRNGGWGPPFPVLSRSPSRQVR